jgi:hypothetical protein
VRVYGEEADVSAFKELVSNLDVQNADQRLFDFNKVLPMPKEVEDTVVPDANPDQQLIEKYGYDNWYDWCIAIWGTKWSASEVEVVCDEGDMVEYNLSSAWGPPVGVYLAIVNRFRRLDVEWFYDEPYDRVAGYLTVEEARLTNFATEEFTKLMSAWMADEASTVDLIGQPEATDVDI